MSPAPPDPGQCWSRRRARDHGVSVAQSDTHGKLLSSAPRSTKHMGPCPVIWKPGGDPVTAVGRSLLPGFGTGVPRRAPVPGETDRYTDRLDEAAGDADAAKIRPDQGDSASGMSA
jgi:hypothetical protein